MLESTHKQKLKLSYPPKIIEKTGYTTAYGSCLVRGLNGAVPFWRKPGADGMVKHSRSDSKSL